ncbi:MAG: arylesterase [Candidatus Absconditabacteria bacterium]
MKKSLLIVSLLLVFFIAGCKNSSNPSPTTKQQIQEPTQQFFVLGDSLTAGYRLAFEDSYPAQLEQKLQAAGYEIKVINSGESGDTSAGLKDRLNRVTAEAKTGDIALIVIGGNDGLQGLPIPDLQQNITNIVTTLQSLGLKVIIGGMQLPTNLGESYRNQFANVYPTIANQTNSILIPFILTGVAGVPELNLPDGIHPNPAGQSIIAQTIFDTFIANKDILTTNNQ